MKRSQQRPPNDDRQLPENIVAKITKCQPWHTEIQRRNITMLKRLRADRIELYKKQRKIRNIIKTVNQAGQGTCGHASP